MEPLSKASRMSRAITRGEALLPLTIRVLFGLRIELKAPCFAWLEMPKPWKRRGFAAAKIADDFVHYMIQLVRRFRAGDTGLSGQLAGKLSLAHFGPKIPEAGYRNHITTSTTYLE